MAIGGFGSEVESQLLLNDFINIQFSISSVPISEHDGQKVVKNPLLLEVW